MKKLLFAVLCLSVFLSFAITGSAQAEEKKADGEGPGVLFVELNPLILPIINSRGVTQMISLVIAVEVDTQENADKVTHYSPKLTDAYLSALYGSLSRNSPDDGVVPLAYVKKQLNSMSDKVLGEHVVKDVLVQVLQSQRT